MKVSIYSRPAIEQLLDSEDFPDNVAVVSLYDPQTVPVDYSRKTTRVFAIEIHDLDLSALPMVNLSYNTYFPEVGALARFIYKAYWEDVDIICQCEYGESRSSACAAAILEHFYKTGISVFSDFRYYPNQVVYRKIFDALEALSSEHKEELVGKEDQKYFHRSINEQMSWIGAEVERIIKRNIKMNIKKEGRAAYGETGYTHTIKRIFGIIKADPKNKALLREVCRAEQELKEFLYEGPEALSEQEIYNYWNAYLQSWISEAEFSKDA